MSKQHHNPQRNSMMPAPAQPNPEPPSMPAEMVRAYSVRRVAEGWEHRILLLPAHVVEQYTARAMPVDVLPIVVAKIENDIQRVAQGMPGAERG